MINNKTLYEVKAKNSPCCDIKTLDELLLLPSAAPLVEKFEELLQIKKLEDFHKNSMFPHENPPNLDVNNHNNNNSNSNSDKSCQIINSFKPSAKAATKKKSLFQFCGETVKQELKRENESFEYLMKLETKSNQNNSETTQSLNLHSNLTNAIDSSWIEEKKTNIEEKKAAENNESANQKKFSKRRKGKYVHKKLRESIKIKQLIVKDKTVSVYRSWKKKGKRTDYRELSLEQIMKEAPEQFAKFLARLYKTEIKQNKL